MGYRAGIAYICPRVRVKRFDGALCFFSVNMKLETVNFLLQCPYFKENVDPPWYNLHLKVTAFTQTEGIQICSFKIVSVTINGTPFIGGLSGPSL